MTQLSRHDICEHLAEHAEDAERDNDLAWAAILNAVAQATRAYLDFCPSNPGPMQVVVDFEALLDQNEVEIIEAHDSEEAVAAARRETPHKLLPAKTKPTSPMYAPQKNDSDMDRHPRDWSFGRPYVWQLSQKEKKALVEACNRARYANRVSSMRALVNMLLERGFTPMQIEALVKSKHLRRSQDTDAPITSKSFAQYLDTQQSFSTWRKIQKELDELVAGHEATIEQIKRRLAESLDRDAARRKR